MKKKRKIILVLTVLLAPPILLLVLFALNGLVMCDGNTPRSGCSASSVSAPVPNSGQLRVLSYNIAKCFVYEGGAHFAKPAEVERRLRTISEIIRAANPDVVCLSEVVRGCGPCNIDQVSYLSKHTGLTNWVFGENYSFGLPFYRVVSGNAILSRYALTPRCNIPLVGRKPFYVMKNNRRALSCVVLSPYGNLPFWALHNDSFNLSNNMLQVEQLLAHPFSQDAFMAGDFNAQPADPSLLLIKTSGRWSGVYNGPFTFPSERPVRTIDFVLAPASWYVQEHHVVTDTISDHCAVVTVFVKRVASNKISDVHLGSAAVPSAHQD